MRLAYYRHTAGRALLVASTLFSLYTAGFGLFSATTQRGLHWFLLCSSLFLLTKSSQEDRNAKSFVSGLWNTIALIMTVASSLYLLMNWEARVTKVGAISLMDTVMAVMMIVVVLEATRRTTGKLLMFITLGFMLYALLGAYFPQPLGHRGQSLERLSNFLYFTTEGIYGVPMGISATYIILFVIFGAFLEKFGIGSWFIDISYAIAGRFRGGPAKTAIFSSGLMGMISGSPVANVATVGTLTIPLMKKVGYKPHQAAAIEAVASTGGMFTPPIMGAGAFIMAEYLNVPYADVAVAAILPAALFYISILLCIDSQAVKMGIVGLSAAELPKIKESLVKNGYLALPLAALVIAIIVGWSPMKAAFWSTVLTFVLALLSPRNRPNVKSLLQVLENGSRDVISIAASCASAGIIVGVIAITGLGTKLSYLLIDLSHGHAILALAFSMLIAIILGCGMPPTAVYIIGVSILVPPLVQLGVSPLAAHMFLFIFSSIAAITPPVAITAYAAAAIAKSNPNETGFAAFRLGLIAFIIPFMFVYSPSLLMQGAFTEVSVSIVSSLVGVCCLVAAVEGYLLMHWGKVNRVVLGLSSLLLLDEGLLTDAIAVILILIVYITQRYTNSRLRGNSNKGIAEQNT